MAKPEATVVRAWRDLAEEGYLYAEISRKYPPFSVDQVRHYCLGHTGRKIGGPIQKVDRWYGSNVWLRGANSPHAELTEKQARRVLDDWDEKAQAHPARADHEGRRGGAALALGARDALPGAGNVRLPR